MLAHSVAICTDDGRIISIEEIYTITEDGFQVNIPDKVEAIRKLGQEGKLICVCGCGGNLILKAGQKMLRRQHFSLKPDTGNGMCVATMETETTILSRIYLKGWLEQTFSASGGVWLHVPFSSLVENGRKYQFTLYLPSRKMGIVYERLATNLERERLEYLSSQTDYCVFSITDIENRHCYGQFPEYNMRQQSVLGYCFFLCLGDSYSSTTAAVSYYQENRKGTWSDIEICSGKLSCFSIVDGSLCFEGEPVETLKAKRIGAFLDEEKAEAEEDAKKQAELQRLINEYKEKQAEEKIKRDALLEIAREKALKCEEQNVQKRADVLRTGIELSSTLYEQEKFSFLDEHNEQGGDTYLDDYPVKKALYDFLSDCASVYGIFHIVNRFGEYECRRVLVYIRKVSYDKINGDIILYDTMGKHYRIHMQSYPSDKARVYPNGGICLFPFYKCKGSVDLVLSYFKETFSCTLKDGVFLEKGMVAFKCGLIKKMDHVYCYDYDKGVCGRPDTACGFKRTD